jgi:diguanylate cyclase (GGDEF)-like protein
MPAPLNLLLVEDNAADVALIRHQLGEAGDDGWQIEHVTRVGEASSRLSAGSVDLVLLDLNLPDASGLDTLDAIRAIDRGVPIVVLTGVDDERLALAALDHGAQDYLVKGETTGRWLSKAIKYAGQRYRLQKELAELALVDELTGVYNRRGFLLVAGRECEALRRAESGVAITALDVDGLKRINDAHGHAAGDAAIRLVADALRAALRQTDILGRIGGDEFACLVRDATPEASRTALDRIHCALRRLVEKARLPYDLGVSAGSAFRPGYAVVTLEELLQEADRALYGEKTRARS